jgi:hypothetical protein
MSLKVNRFDKGGWVRVAIDRFPDIIRTMDSPKEESYTKASSACNLRRQAGV